MELIGYYPVIATEKLSESRDFYTRYFNFEIGFESEWYVHLNMTGRPDVQLAFVNYQHQTIPAGFRQATQGMILNFEVEDVDAEYQRLMEAGLPMHLTLRSEDWGQRHFITADPNGVLIDMIKIIPPSDDVAQLYSEKIWE